MKTINISKDELKQLYDKDYPLWVDINLQLLKDKAYEFVDWDNLLEEIEDMGARHLEACISYLAVILEHLYKWDNFKNLAGGENAGNKWIRSIQNSRDRIDALFSIYPSLKSKLPSEIGKAWYLAKAEIRVWLRKNGQNPDNFNIPQECPYTYQEAMERDLKEKKDR
ncbi:DUF29 domain-containing protein [Sulfurihydrogenibium sp.]|uniref:DUF29 domain-containing protein n=1 Tax=Sulfurihydrogenibium sp. TaxID=2053621 RepID=UPI00260B727E|nr:DUF29 domain-containing protein [Sulfurihydrogenibium sp.]